MIYVRNTNFKWFKAIFQAILKYILRHVDTAIKHQVIYIELINFEGRNRVFEKYWPLEGWEFFSGVNVHSL